MCWEAISRPWSKCIHADLEEVLRKVALKDIVLQAQASLLEKVQHVCIASCQAAVILPHAHKVSMVPANHLDQRYGLAGVVANIWQSTTTPTHR